MKQLIRHILREHTTEVMEQGRFKNFDVNDESFAKIFNYFLAELKNNIALQLIMTKYEEKVLIIHFQHHIADLNSKNKN